MRSRIIFFLTLVFLPGALVAESVGFENEYEVYVSDINSDGQLDIYVKEKPRFVILHGDIPTPILLPHNISDFALIQQPDQGFRLADDNEGYNVDALQLAAQLTILIRDVNFDGAEDLVIKNLAAEISGADDLIIYSALESGSRPSSIKTISTELREFVEDMNAFLSNSSYFTQFATPISGTVLRSKVIYVPEFCGSAALDFLASLPPDESSYVNQEPNEGPESARLVEVCEDEFGVDANIHFDFVVYEWEEEVSNGFDYSYYSPLALSLASDYDDVFENKELDPSSIEADIMSILIERVLGEEFKPWNYSAVDADDISISVDPFDSIRMLLKRLESILALDTIIAEAEIRSKAIQNIEDAKNILFADMRDGDLTLIDLDESQVRESFDGIKIEVVSSCGKTAKACLKYKSWLTGAGVQKVRIKIVDTAVQDLGSAIEVLAHELRHLSLDNREYGVALEDYDHPAEVDARVKGKAVRQSYGL